MIENQSTLWTILPKAKRRSTFSLKLQLINPIFVFHLYFVQGKSQMSLTLSGSGTSFCTRSRKELPLYVKYHFWNGTRELLSIFSFHDCNMALQLKVFPWAGSLKQKFTKVIKNCFLCLSRNLVGSKLSRWLDT